MIKDRGYPYILKWGRYLGSQDYYIQEQCDKAAAAGAPADATHINDDGKTWSTTSDIASQRTRMALKLEPLKAVDLAALRVYAGVIVHKEQATGVDNYLYQVRFPDMLNAAAWAREYKISERVNLVPFHLTDAGFHPFDRPVVVALQPD